MLLEIWVPEYGIIYDELKEIERGKYDPIEFEEEKPKERGDGSSIHRKKVSMHNYRCGKCACL